MPKLILPDATFDKCALCNSLSPLRTSHIIPKFVFRWFKDSSATGHLRFGGNPDRRVQDGLKTRMLCVECEQRLSSWERNFYKQCFRPILEEDVKEIDYSSWMLKFATSVSWRVLRYFSAAGQLSDYPSSLRSSVEDVLLMWSEYLLDKRSHPDPYEQHMLLLDAIGSGPIDGLLPNINRYLIRAIQFDVMHSEVAAITYTKMGRLVLFGFIAMPSSHNWQGTKLNANHGTFGIRDIELPSCIFDYMIAQAESAGSLYSGISKTQQEKIRKSYKENLSRAEKSETIRAMHHDVQLFGNRAFEFTQPSTRTATTESDDENAKKSC